MRVSRMICPISISTFLAPFSKTLRPRFPRDPTTRGLARDRSVVLAVAVERSGWLRVRFPKVRTRKVSRFIVMTMEMGMGIGMRPENKRAGKVCGALAVEKKGLARFRVRSRLKKRGLARIRVRSRLKARGLARFRERSGAKREGRHGLGSARGD